MNQGKKTHGEDISVLLCVSVPPWF